MNLDFKFSANQVISQGRTSKENLDFIKEWIRMQDGVLIPHLIADELIVLFLMCSDNDLNVTINAITSFYKLRQEAPEIFDNRNIDNEDLILAISTMTMICIPTRTQTNDVILLFKLNDSDHRNFDCVSKMKLCFMIMDLTYHDNPPNGLLLVVDTAKFGFKHMSRIKMETLKMFFTYLQEALPLKLTGFHFLNSSFVLRTLWSMVKVFIREDVLKKFLLHSPDGTKELFKYIPKSCLPVNYGGDLPDVNILQNITLQKLRANQEFWNREELIRKRKIKMYCK